MRGRGRWQGAHPVPLIAALPYDTGATADAAADPTWEPAGFDPAAIRRHSDSTSSLRSISASCLTSKRASSPRGSGGLLGGEDTRVARRPLWEDRAADMKADGLVVVHV